jgi:hypothetical protein
MSPYTIFRLAILFLAANNLAHLIHRVTHLSFPMGLLTFVILLLIDSKLQKQQ